MDMLELPAWLSPKGRDACGRHCKKAKNPFPLTQLKPTRRKSPAEKETAPRREAFGAVPGLAAALGGKAG